LTTASRVTVSRFSVIFPLVIRVTVQQVIDKAYELNHLPADDRKCHPYWLV
jgi:hypothetical protein